MIGYRFCVNIPVHEAQGLLPRPVRMMIVAPSERLILLPWGLPILVCGWCGSGEYWLL